MEAALAAFTTWYGDRLDDTDVDGLDEIANRISYALGFECRFPFPRRTIACNARLVHSQLHRIAGQSILSGNCAACTALRKDFVEKLFAYFRPRNCDMYDSGKEARKAWRKWYNKKTEENMAAWKNGTASFFVPPSGFQQWLFEEAER